MHTGGGCLPILKLGCYMLTYVANSTFAMHTKGQAVAARYPSGHSYYC